MYIKIRFVNFGERETGSILDRPNFPFTKMVTLKKGERGCVLMKISAMCVDKPLGWNFVDFIGKATVMTERGEKVTGSIYSIDHCQYAKLSSKFGDLFFGFNGIYDQWAFSEHGGAVLVFYTEIDGQLLVAGGYEKRILINDGETLFTPPGGFGLNSEDPKQTSARETLEETGIHITSAKYVGGFTPNRAFWIKEVEQPWPVSVFACKVDPELLCKDENGYFIPGKEGQIAEMDKISKLLFVPVEEAYESGDGIAVTAFAKVYSAWTKKQI